MILTTTLSAAAAAAIINLWLMIRCAQIRVSAKVAHGDGGNVLLGRRMRAHSNFIENAPLVLILIGAIELTGKGGTWLALVAAVYLLARVAHPFGMDRDGANVLRAGGTMVTMLTLIGLATMAVLISLGKF
ncbi:hypothetical protein NT2_02_01690 [Caenibius tardaugens NBRC 16725]|uniref:MAPEG family protein n=1 Tax=Caenibius tardaugens NBRC 16725 TaxID=1219035 RepID=U2YIV9_9SPHN|nr:MAPEG family protein [Caenibius tardaugens]AZI34582.1 MAPEG family protein [Caenibius tardaugens NBRC 16725]GAD48087.1 hypothetical protein NT2_02_01690 [Caenibius tardaugens NBRC 16725]